MNNKQIKKITQFVAKNIGEFHDARLKTLKSIKLIKILKRGNPYLMKAKNIEIASEFVRILYDRYLLQGERTAFGNFLEKLAVYVGEELYQAEKSGIEGMDLEFVRDGMRYIVSIKSGPNWGNSSGVKKQEELFKKALQTVRQNNRAYRVSAVLGCCFGRDKRPDKGVYYKYCGQEFWNFLSGDDKLYLDIIEPLGHQAKEKNEEFAASYSKILNIAVADFMKDYCQEGVIDWEKLVKLNSEKEIKKA